MGAEVSRSNRHKMTGHWSVEHSLSLLPYKIRIYMSSRGGDFPGGSDGKASVYNEGDLGSIPRFGRSPGEGNGNPLQYSCLENPTDGGAW